MGEGETSKDLKMRNTTLRLLAVSAIWAICPELAFAAESPAVGTVAPASLDQIAGQARYWEARGRYDLARESWLKLLRISPNSADALAGLANAELRSGRMDAAQMRLDRLKQAHPDHPQINEIQAAIRQGSFDSSKLTQPRALARQGKYDQAVAAYRAVYNNQIPGGRLGLEYYQTLAGTETGWAEARAGIEKLAAENPSDPLYRLALAQHLTYREDTRRQGITGLAAVADQPAVSALAKAAWRQALLWLGVKPGDEELYRGYLRRYGEDPQVGAKLATGRNPEAGPAAAGAVAAVPYTPGPEELRGRMNRDAFTLLNNNQLEQAAEKFNQSIGQYGPSADALGGLGVIRLRLEDYTGARELLQKASAMSGSSAGRWSEALSTARFWEAARAAGTARRQGNNKLAEQEYRRAISIDPHRAQLEPSVPVSLADLLVEVGQADEAEKYYREAYRLHPTNADAFRGMLSVLARNGKLKEAAAMADAAPDDLRQKLGGIGAIKAQYLRYQADGAFREGNDLKAEKLLKEALIADPESPWTRLQLAGVYQRQHRTRDANTLIDGLLASGSVPVRPEALFVKASLLSEQQHPYEALQVLEQIAPGERTPSMSRLQKQVWLRYQAQRAAIYARFGEAREAASLMAQVEPYMAEMPELTSTVAGVYADLGDSSRALSYLRQSMKNSSKPDLGLRLQYAGLLFRLRQDAEFEVVMEDLGRETRMNSQQRVDYSNLRLGYRLRQADLMREDGDLATAYEALQPLLAAAPNDPALLMALARLYNDSKDFEQAQSLYQRVLAQNPKEIDAYKGAIGAALALGEQDQADVLLQRALAIAPRDARLYALAGRSANARGDEGRALSLFQQALRLDAQQNSAGSTPGNMGSQPMLQIIDPQPNQVRPLPGSGKSVGALPGLHKMAFKAGDQKHQPAKHPARVTAAVWHPIRARAGKASRYGDVALPPLRAFYSAALIKSSTRTKTRKRPRSAASTAPANTEMIEGGYWTEERDANGNLSYRYIEPLPGVPQVSEPAPKAVNDFSDIQPARRSISPAATAPVYGPNTRVPSPPVAPAYPPPSAIRTGESDYWRLPAAPTAPPLLQAPLPGAVEPLPAPVDPLAGLKGDPLKRGLGFTPNRKAEPTPERRELLTEINELSAKRSAYFSGGLSGRSRDGVEGLDRLYDFEAPLEAAFPATAAGRLKLRIVPVSLDAGTVSGSNVLLFGSNAFAYLLDPTIANRSFAVNESGIAPSLGYELGSFKADIGSSPLGFQVENVVGGLNWQPKGERVSFKFDLARRSVTDSVLSYAGLKDPATNKTWGGITKNGLRADVAYSLGRYGVYGNGGYHVLTGKDVPQNNVAEVGVGFYARGIERSNLRFTYGINLTALRYKRNLRRFTLGHGGYFSPRSYFSAALPLTLEGFRNRLSYKIGASVGFQSFREEGAALYPNDAGLQERLNTFLNTLANAGPDVVQPTLTVQGGYPARRQSGLGFSFEGQAEYLLDPNLSIGGRFSLDNARDYNELGAIGYVRYFFTGQSHVGSPPWVLQPNYNFADPRL